MKDKIQFLQDKIHPNTCGLLWFTKENLRDKPKPFYTLNYFFDGLLVNFFQEEKKDENRLPNLFLTKNFDQNLFLGHFHLSTSSLEQKVKTFLNITENMADEGSKILILFNEKDGTLPSNLFKKSKYFQFEKLETAFPEALI